MHRGGFLCICYWGILCICDGEFFRGFLCICDREFFCISFGDFYASVVRVMKFSDVLLVVIEADFVSFLDKFLPRDRVHFVVNFCLSISKPFCVNFDLLRD